MKFVSAKDPMTVGDITHKMERTKGFVPSY